MANNTPGDEGHVQGFPDKKGEISLCFSSYGVVKNVVYRMNSSTIKPAHILSSVAPCQLHLNELHPTTPSFSMTRPGNPQRFKWEDDGKARKLTLVKGGTTVY